MKLSDIKIGGLYTAKVSGRIAKVRVTEIKEVPPAAWSSRSAWRTLIIGVNESTGRRITIRSPQRLRRAVGGCEFCQQKFNRPGGAFKCPYCGHIWPGSEAGK